MNERPRRRKREKGERDARASGGARGGGRARRTTGASAEPRDRGEATYASTSRYDPVHLSDDVVRELHSSARPTKGDILVKVFSDAIAAYAAGDVGEAIRLGDQAKHMALRSTNVREFLGLAYYSAERWKEAARELSAFRRIAGSTEQNPVIADTYRALSKPEKAVELIDEMEPERVPEPVYFEGTIVAAGALTDMGRIDDALARLEALNLDPAIAQEHHLRAWYVLADLLERRGRFTQARSWFEAIAAADPDLTDAPERAARLT
jgi:tetratricopeptide (TPR) repeat protein